jgi:hypothetical protein
MNSKLLRLRKLISESQLIAPFLTTSILGGFAHVGLFL